MNKTALLFLALGLAVTIGCKSDSDAKQSPKAVADISKSLDALRAEFNAHKNEPRFVTLISPT